MTAQPPTLPTRVGIAGLRRSVVDLARSVDFYRGALGFELVGRGPQPARNVWIRLGSECIELVATDAASAPAPAVAPDPRFQHAAIVARDMEAAWRRLMSFQPATITIGGPQRLPALTGGVTAFKFRDPDGHPLELIAFPYGTGAPRWRSPSTSLTLGIDHVALVVTDADRSIAFYAAQRFELVSRQINQGVEQARLDGLANPVVEVVALAIPAAPTPHLELLCYRQPRSNAPPRTEAARGRDGVIVIASPLETGEIDFIDPDGHLMLLSSAVALLAG